MSRNQRNLLLVVLGVSICLGVIFLVLKKCEKEGMRAHTIGTVLAINAALLSELEKGNSGLKEIFCSADEQWWSIAVPEYDKAITELDDKSYDLDDGSARPLLDLWGSRLVIVYRKLPSGFYDFLVVSKGPDGIYGTEDDVVSSYGVSPPSFDIKKPKGEQKE